MQWTQKNRRNVKEKNRVAVPRSLTGSGPDVLRPPGTLDYREAWVYCTVLLVPFVFVINCLLRKDPELLARRIRLREKESAQKRDGGAASLIFFTGFLIPGLDHRYGWSDIPVVTVHAANALVSEKIRLPPGSWKSNQTRR